MRRLERPLNPEFVEAANKALKAETGGRSLMSWGSRKALLSVVEPGKFNRMISEYQTV